MKEAKKHEQEFELRSEKVRSIVGQIPSSLVRYGNYYNRHNIDISFCSCILPAV